MSVVVIGGGQAGLAAAYYLCRQPGLDFAVLDGGPRIGHVWHRRWDSLRTFTSARYCSLPGLAFPGPPDRYPGKNEIAEYLARYATHFDIPIRLDSRVTAVRRVHDGFEVQVTTGTVIARSLIIATGAFGAPFIPAFGSQLPVGVRQLHSSEYRNPDQIGAGPVLVVGAGNSGIQIARELAGGREVMLSHGRPRPELPQQVLGRDIFWWMSIFGVMTAPVELPLVDALTGSDPVVGNRLQQMAQDCAVHLVGRARGVSGGQVITDDGECLAPATVIWATGYRHDWSWLAPEFLDGSGMPRHAAGVGAVMGSYYLGLYRLKTRGSALLGFVRRDAERIVAHLVDHLDTDMTLVPDQETVD
ncbi:NAD(P)/FAD-dependent oxidoreductase [Frankia sp. Cppng1_Ct_nod]|uniref:flavin-containing monooxygenase n=1 Tax=Frankia sp. Cppng1_Ct_nod TaxID=2897162 RepID=UPI0013EF820B|nr:NAD(P)/FAD-dependent oxidoreductase [Frankia sp. Cppng1_Ct_nod]